MKVWKRVLIKTIIFLLVVAAGSAAGIAYRESQTDTAQYVLERYAQHLIHHETDQAYRYQDTQMEGSITQEEFAAAAEARNYSLYAGFHLEKVETRKDENGNEYEDYRISFVNSDDEEQAAEEISVRKQAEKKFFFFDQWKVMPDHCMVKDFVLQVPAGSAVVLSGESLEEGLLQEGGGQSAVDTYIVPEILPGTAEVTVSHDIFETLTASVDTMEQTVDLCPQMQLSDGGRAAALELGVETLREIYRLAIVNAQSASQQEDGLFEACEDQADQFIGTLQDELEAQSEEGYALERVAVWEYNPRYGQMTFTEGQGIQVDLELAYQYSWTFQQQVLEETGEYDEYGEPILTETSQEDIRPGDAAAGLTLSYYDGSWHLSGMDVPQTLE